MALELKDILQTMKKTYGFRVNVACVDDEVCDTEKMKALDIILKAKGMTTRSNPKALPLSAQPIIFKRLTDFLGTYYTFEMDFEYPLTPSELTNEICTLLNIDRAFVVVRSSDNPTVQEEDDYLEYDENDYIPQLITDEMPNNINREDMVGDEMVKQFTKKILSPEAKKYQGAWEEVDKKNIKVCNG